MYRWNLILKRGDIDHDAANVMAMMQVTDHFDSLTRFNVTAILDNEVVVTVYTESKRSAQGILGDWFVEDDREEDGNGWPVGSLLHYREILSDERI